MRHNKFFNNLDNKEVNNENNNIKNNEYSNQIPISKVKFDENIDRNNPIVKLFLILLGLFCIIGTIYYVVTYFIIK